MVFLGVHLSWDDASAASSAAQDKGELTDLCQASWYNPADVSVTQREDCRQHHHCQDKLSRKMWNERRKSLSDTSQNVSWSIKPSWALKKCEVITFKITTDRVKTSKMVNSYRTNVGNTCSPVKKNNNTSKFCHIPFKVKVFKMDDVASDKISITGEG